MISSTAAAFAFLWVVGSVPFGIVVGRALATLAGQPPLDVLGAAAEPVRRSRHIPPMSTAHRPPVTSAPPPRWSPAGTPNVSALLDCAEPTPASAPEASNAPGTGGHPIVGSAGPTTPAVAGSFRRGRPATAGTTPTNRC